jgi:hypothetical protein
MKKLIFGLLLSFFLVGCEEVNIFEEDDSNDDVSWYKPTADTTWYWQLSGKLDMSVDVDIYDVDLFNTSTQDIKQLQESGKKVMCYISAGSWENFREDKDRFEDKVIGNTLDGWEDEKWLDIRTDNVKNIMVDRISLAKEKGCDGIEPDNIDGYTNDTGFNLTYDDQISYNKFLAQQAHARGMFIALKNDLDQVDDLILDFDLQLNEQCFEYDECDKLIPFIQKDKPVFNAEYNSKYNNLHNLSKLCNNSNELKFKTNFLPLNLDGSFMYSCDEYLYKHSEVGFGGSSSFKFHDNIWLEGADLVFNNLDSSYYNTITDYNIAKFQDISSYLQKSQYIVFWITKGWQESWFNTTKIQSLIDAGYTPVFNYWYFGDELMNGLNDTQSYYDDVKRLKTFLTKLHGTKLLIMEPEFNKENILNNPQEFIETMKNAIDIVKDKEILISLCMTDTGNRSVNETYEKCGYDNCSLGDKYEWSKTKDIYNSLLDKLDFISFQEMVGQFSRNPSDPGTWDNPNPIEYSDDDIGIANLATRIDNFAIFLKDTYNKPVFLPYIAIPTASWHDSDNDMVIDEDEITPDGWETQANLVYKDLNKNKHLFGYATMALFDDPTHDKGGYQFFMQNEYHLGIVKSDILEEQLTGNISLKSTILENIFP